MKATEIDYQALIKEIKGKTVERPNAASSGTLSGHAAGEPFEKLVYKELKNAYKNNIYKQFEYLNDLYRKNPKSITVEQKAQLFDSPVAFFLLSRSDSATRDWNPNNVFEEKQNDTADILFHNNGKFTLIDVKTRNLSKNAMPPNIISAYKVAKMCAIILDNEEYDTVELNYIEIDWEETGSKLKCVDAHVASLFKAKPQELYINWAVAMQIQFHIAEIDQTYKKDVKNWSKDYLKLFVESAEHRCNIMYEKYVAPFKKYIK